MKTKIVTKKPSNQSFGAVENCNQSFGYKRSYWFSFDRKIVMNCKNSNTETKKPNPLYIHVVCTGNTPHCIARVKGSGGTLVSGYLVSRGGRHE